jgi:transposase
MSIETTIVKPNARRYSLAEKEQAIRLVRELRRELGTDKGAAKRVADQLGFGVESVKAWVKQADIDSGMKVGLSSEDLKELKDLRQENKELKRANEILRRASAFFAAELDRPHK